MSETISSTYVPYGAYELKASYQRNLIQATLLVAGLVLTGAVVAGMLTQDKIAAVKVDVAPTVVSAVINPPPTIVNPRPQINISQPLPVASRVGTPVPVSDDEIPDDELFIMSRADLALRVESGRLPDAIGGVADWTGPADELPTDEAHSWAEVMPEMIFSVQPEYPRMALKAGLEGSLWIKALVGIDGNVKEALVLKSSSVAVLDEAALKVAFKNKYRPARQNGRVIAVWVSYQVKFRLYQ